MASSAPEAPSTLTPREAAALIGVAPGTIRRWAASGEIAAFRVGGRLRIQLEAIEQVARPATEQTP